jgi:hypothetical protein
VSTDTFFENIKTEFVKKASEHLQNCTLMHNACGCNVSLGSTQYNRQKHKQKFLLAPMTTLFGRKVTEAEDRRKRERKRRQLWTLSFMHRTQGAQTIKYVETQRLLLLLFPIILNNIITQAELCS